MSDGSQRECGVTPQELLSHAPMPVGHGLWQWGTGRCLLIMGSVMEVEETSCTRIACFVMGRELLLWVERD